MPLKKTSFGLHPFGAVALIGTMGIAWTARLLFAQAPAGVPAPMEPAFQKVIKPFLDQHCAKCHNADNMTAGVRVDHLDTSLDDKHIRFWEGIRHRVKAGTMPPKGLPQPGVAERDRVVEWIDKAIEVAKLRPAPKNGIVRRLTVSQYKNTLRELLHLEDDLTEALPPDAISSDGFVNNKETLQLSPLLLEAYFEIAEDALNRSIIDPKVKPKVQNFRVDLGKSINPNPIPDKLILGANSKLLENQDFTVTQLTPLKPFAFDPYLMKSKYRFIEGYAGNDTVRGWKEYDSIYHSVFACMRGTGGYPKGLAYGLVPQGLLLRPAIPNEEIFEADGTYGPKANFKISLRELPDHGRFRVTVMAARYNDGLMLDSEVAVQKAGSISVDPKGNSEVNIPKAGIYQVDVHQAARQAPSTVTDTSRLKDGLIGSWPFDGATEGAKVEGNARFVVSPFGKAVSLGGEYEFVTIPPQEGLNVSGDDFTVAMWLRPGQLRRAGLAGRGGNEGTHGWYLDMPDGRGSLRLETTGPDGKPNGGMMSPPGVLRPNLWQHVTAVVKRGKNEARLYVNGYAVAKGPVGLAHLDNSKLDLQLGRVPGTATFKGDLDEVRLYRRALDEAEIQALIEPGRQFVRPPPEKNQDVRLTLGEREFAGTLAQQAFVLVRLDAGPLPVRAEITGMAGLEKVVLTPIEEGQELARKFKTFEKRTPRLGVHLGLRRDCGSTFAPVGAPQVVAGTKLSRYVFEGAISNFPSPNVEKDNVNYLAGIREIAVRSEYTDGRDMPRMLIKSVEFEGPFYEQWPPPSHRSIFLDSEKKSDLPTYARQVIRGFATRAYRRPVSAVEEASLMAVYQKSSAAGANFQESVKDSLQVVLTSPQFLFLVEKSSTPKPEAIDAHELASKLSYFLWNGPPDRTTLRLASTGMLARQLDAEVARMVASPRFARFAQEFTSQWLSLDKFNVLEPDRKKFPNLTRDTRVQLRQEPVQFVQHLMRKNLPVKNLIQSDFMMVNEVVASYYGMPEKSESGFQFLAIPHGRKELGGVLTQASILAGLSDGRESNPVKRGAWLARRIIAEPPADPPPNVPALLESEKDLTLRQRLEAHRNQPGCFQCHQKIDPWGVAFEEFDAGGRLKKQPVDAHSKLPDQTEVSGANDLKRYLGEDRIDQVAFSVFKHLATYANGRSLTYNELNELKRDGLKLKASGYPMQDMIRYIVNSKIFLEK